MRQLASNCRESPARPNSVIRRLNRPRNGWIAVVVVRYPKPARSGLSQRQLRKVADPVLATAPTTLPDPSPRPHVLTGRSAEWPPQASLGADYPWLSPGANVAVGALAARLGTGTYRSGTAQVTGTHPHFRCHLTERSEWQIGTRPVRRHGVETAGQPCGPARREPPLRARRAHQERRATARRGTTPT
jgi:hypothetical protein